MPQVDKVTLMPQVFWLVLLFLGVYFYISRSRLKPYYYFLKFKYSFLVMNVYFYIVSFTKDVVTHNKQNLFINYFKLQKNLFNYIFSLENLLNIDFKMNKFKLFNQFFNKFSNFYVQFNLQHEKSTKNII
jgi:hypothetical protein